MRHGGDGARLLRPAESLEVRWQWMGIHFLSNYLILLVLRDRIRLFPRAKRANTRLKDRRPLNHLAPAT